MELEEIFMVNWVSNVDGEKNEYSYACATEEIAKSYFKQCKEKIFKDGHFADMTDEELENCEISDYPTIFFIKDEHDDYWEDVSITIMDIQRCVAQ